MTQAAAIQTPQDFDWGGFGGTEVPCLEGFRAATFDNVDQIDFEPTNALLLEYIATQVKIFEQNTGGAADGSAHITGFWDNIATVLPPHGRFYLTWTEAGDLVGCGALKRINETTGEMKHLYVRPEARGTGLGRWLAEQRLSDARAMGLKEIIVDTVRGNTDMPRLYAKLGFEETEPSQQGTSVNINPDVARGLRYFRKTL